MMKRRWTDSPDKVKPKAKRLSVGAQCVICLEVVTVRGHLESCNHLFCFPCIKEWAKVTNSCPLCKQTFKCISKNSLSGAECSSPEIIHVDDKEQPEWYGEELEDSFSEYTDPSYDSDVYDYNDSFIDDGNVTVSWSESDSDEFLETDVECLPARGTPPLTRRGVRTRAQTHCPSPLTRQAQMNHQCTAEEEQNGRRSRQSQQRAAHFKDSDSDDDTPYVPPTSVQRDHAQQRQTRTMRSSRRHDLVHSPSPEPENVHSLRQRLTRRDRHASNSRRSAVQQIVAENLQKTGSSGWLGRPLSGQARASRQRSPTISPRIACIHESRNWHEQSRNELLEGSRSSPFGDAATQRGGSCFTPPTHKRTERRTCWTPVKTSPSRHEDEVVWLLPSPSYPRLCLERDSMAEIQMRRKKHPSAPVSPPASSRNSCSGYASLSPTRSVSVSPTGNLDQAFCEGSLASDTDLFATSPEDAGPTTRRMSILRTPEDIGSTTRRMSTLRSHGHQKNLHGSWASSKDSPFLWQSHQSDEERRSDGFPAKCDVAPLRERLAKRRNSKILAGSRWQIELSDSDNDS